MASLRTADETAVFIAANGLKPSKPNFRGSNLVQTTHRQFFQYHSKSHHLNASTHPFNFYIELTPIECDLNQQTHCWDLVLDYSDLLRNH